MANILIFGASITYGFYDNEGGWVDRLKKDLLKYSWGKKLEHDLKVYNLGISGNTSTQVLDRLDCEAKPRKWRRQESIIIFAVGINDTILTDGKFKIPKVQFERNLNLLLKKSKKYTEKIIFVGLTPVVESRVGPMPWSPTESYKNNNIKAYDKIVRDFCKMEGLLYTELFSKFWKKDYKKLLPDGVHPNTEGHKLIYETVKKELLKSKILTS